MLISPPLVVKVVAPSSLAVSVTAVSSVFMAHLSLLSVASAVAWFKCSTAVNTIDIFCCEKTYRVVNTRRHSTASDTLIIHQSLTISWKSLSFLKPLLVVILALHFGHSAPHFRMLSFTQPPQNRWRHSGMTCGSEYVSRQMEHSKLLSTKDVSLERAELRWLLLVVFWVDIMLFQMFVCSYCFELCFMAFRNDRLIEDGR